ncbi:hypothetical protein C8Q77DRAFT_1210382 [Trametes polyzona]|nr:hypothetical protein C8Q77DRAFT_1210382 [Trametes polyzona]
MNVTFTANSPHNSPVVDMATGQALFYISTPYSLLSARDMTMTDAGGQVVGVYKRGFINDEVVYRGVEGPLSDWLVQKSIFSRRRRFVAPDGRTYEWRWGTWTKSELTLVDVETEQLVARGLRSVMSLFSSSQKLGLEVAPGGTRILDAIVFSFVICELLTRRREKSRAAASA